MKVIHGGPIYYYDRETVPITIQKLIPLSQIDDFNRLFLYEQKRKTELRRFKSDIQDKIKDRFYQEAQQYIGYKYVGDNYIEWDESMNENGLYLTGVFTLVRYTEKAAEPKEEEEVVTENYVGKIVFIENKDSKDSYGRGGEYIVVKQSPNSLFCLPVTVGFEFNSFKTFYFTDINILSVTRDDDFVLEVAKEGFEYAKVGGSWSEEHYNKVKRNSTLLTEIVTELQAKDEVPTEFCADECEEGWNDYDVQDGINEAREQGISVHNMKDDDVLIIYVSKREFHTEANVRDEEVRTFHLYRKEKTMGVGVPCHGY